MSRSRRPRPQQPAPAVVRVTTPGQLVAALPVSLGYTPSESLVVVCCHEPRGRLGLTMRVDLPEPEHEDALVAQVDAVVRRQHATRVVLVVYTEAPDGELRARAALMEGLLDAFDDLVVTEALLVRAGRWSSYLCELPCCPPGGTPVAEAAESAAVQTLRLEHAARGLAQLGRREDLEASIAGPCLLAAAEAEQRCDEALERYAERILDRGIEQTRAEALARWRRAVALVEDPRRQLPAAEAAALVASLQDVQVRDAVAALWEERDNGLRRLLEEVARRTPASYDAPVCTTLAWVTYCDGGGSLTTIALDRALRAEPDYSMARLLRHALDHALSPDVLRGVTRRTRQALEGCA